MKILVLLFVLILLIGAVSAECAAGWEPHITVFAPSAITQGSNLFTKAFVYCKSSSGNIEGQPGLSVHFDLWRNGGQMHSLGDAVTDGSGWAYLNVPVNDDPEPGYSVQGGVYSLYIFGFSGLFTIFPPGVIVALPINKCDKIARVLGFCIDGLFPPALK